MADTAEAVSCPPGSSVISRKHTDKPHDRASVRLLAASAAATDARLPPATTMSQLDTACVRGCACVAAATAATAAHQRVTAHAHNSQGTEQGVSNAVGPRSRRLWR
jgi:hypothetical protein